MTPTGQFPRDRGGLRMIVLGQNEPYGTICAGLTALFVGPVIPKWARALVRSIPRGWSAVNHGSRTLEQSSELELCSYKTVL